MIEERKMWKIQIIIATQTGKMSQLKLIEYGHFCHCFHSCGLQWHMGSRGIKECVHLFDALFKCFFFLSCLYTDNTSSVRSFPHMFFKGPISLLCICLSFGRVEFTQLAADYKAVNLGQGFPDFSPPAFIQEAFCKAVSGACPMHQYTRAFVRQSPSHCHICCLIIENYVIYYNYYYT